MHFTIFSFEVFFFFQAFVKKIIIDKFSKLFVFEINVFKKETLNSCISIKH